MLALAFWLVLWCILRSCDPDCTWLCSGLGEIGVEQPHPRFLKGTKEHHFVRVAAGASHSLALTSSGQVWSFGQGSFGTLGAHHTRPPPPRPHHPSPHPRPPPLPLALIVFCCVYQHRECLQLDVYFELGPLQSVFGFPALQGASMADVWQRDFAQNDVYARHHCSNVALPLRVMTAHHRCDTWVH